MRDPNIQPRYKPERNHELYMDYKHGMTGVYMVQKYQISTQRMHRIIKSIEARLKEQTGVEL
jgi:Mor family transcriptional regulator